MDGNAVDLDRNSAGATTPADAKGALCAMREISPAQNWLFIVLGLVLSGILYDVMMSPGRLLPVVGPAYAIAMGMPIIAFERRATFRKLRRKIDELPSLPYLLASLLAYQILMSAGYAVASAGLLLLGMIKAGSLVEAVVMPVEVLLYGFAVCLLIIFILRVRDLLGRDVFTSMLISRYRQPVTEERVFLFIDLAGSTAYAEKHGDLRAQQYLKAIFSTFAEPVRRHKGAINDYVGDAAIITWPLARGIKDARCVRCVFDILSEIDAHARTWKHRFGEVPRLRAALHGGPIVTAEIGVDHHKIAFFGDTVNTTARIETLCKTLGRDVLISHKLAAQIVLPDAILVEDLGQHDLKGRGHMLGVAALSARKTAERPIHLPIPAE